MENTNQAESICATSYDQLNVVASRFASEEEMKKYYLQMSDTINANTPFIRRTDFTQLKGLHQKLKQFIVALQHLSTHKWGSSVAEIQNACGAYMMQSNIDKKTLMKTNNEIGQHLQFIMQLAGDMTPIKQLLGILNFHYQNVEYLMGKV